jgi:hypothetical protein
MLTAGLISLGSISGSAFADAPNPKKVLQEALKLQETRAKELAGVAKNDDKLAKEVEKYVDAREKAAAAMEAKAKEMHDAAAVATGDDQKDLTDFANEMDTYAKHDHDMVAKRKEAMTILQDQAKGAEEGVKNHEASIAKIKAKLAKMK